jgi:ketosteroid isomerase-like protein
MTARVQRRHVPVRSAAIALILGAMTAPASAQWVRQNEQFYLPASHNWVFRDNYMGADRLFNAFDYGHAILYETLLQDLAGAVERLEVDEYDFLTRRLLRKPPRVPVEEAAIEVAYAKLVPEAKLMFEWAHLLHRQLYDVLADERLSMNAKDAAIAELLAYYRTRPDLAFSALPKSMDLMDGQPYSLVFRQRFPKFNGLIWAYHWLQVGLYEPLLVNHDAASRAKGVNATVGRFWQMLEQAPETMPYLMPMTGGVAPAFAERYPEAAIIFDNLHMMHDVISDILASPDIPRAGKRQEILRAAALFRDDTSYIIALDEWQAMGSMMGVHNMGGTAVGFAAELPVPTVPRGMSMAGMEHAAHGGVQAPAETGHADHAGTDMPADSADIVAAVDAYHRALATGDSALAISLLTDDAVILESGGMETLSEYRAGHLPGDIAFARAVPRERSPIRVVVQGDIAWATSTSTVRGQYGDRAVNSAGAELMVLTRSPEGWRIAAIHWSSRALRN